MDFEQDHTRTLKDTWNINVPPYAEDPLAKYFLFHQNSAKITSTYSSSDGAAYWDSAAAFIDMRVEYDKDANKCVPKVKVDSPDEEMKTLVSIDGVDTQCLLEFAAGLFQKEAAEEPLEDNHYAQDYVWDSNHPIDVLSDIRKWQRAASGGAPPTSVDEDSKVKVVLKDKDGNLETVETELTYKKYQMMSGVKANRKETMHQDKCSVMPIATDADDNQIFAGPFGYPCTTWDGSQEVVKEDCDAEKRFRFVYPDSCPRMIDGKEEKRVEKRSKEEYRESIKPGTMKMGMVGRRINLNTGEEQKNSYYPDLAEMDYCEIYISGITDSNGRSPGSLCDLEKVEVPEPKCDFPSLMATTVGMEQAIDTLKGGSVRPSSEYFMPKLGSDAWGECSNLIDNALVFTDKEMDIETTECGRTDYDSPEYQNDPCCNWELQATKCCAPRRVMYPVPQAAVDTAALAYYCAEDVEQLATAIYAAKDYVEKRKQTTDQHKGCFHDKQSKVDMFRQFSDVGKNCSKEVIGEYTNGEERSSATCSIDDDCYTGTCKPAADGEKVRYCQTSRLTKYVVKCLNDKLEGLDKAKAMMKDIFAEGNMDATEEETAAGLGRAAGRQTCTGNDGWKYDPDWRNCKEGKFDSTTNECTDYYCDSHSDCKAKCEGTGKACNTKDSWWQEYNAFTEEDCAVDILDNGGKFCAKCWGGEGQNCYEISKPSHCRLTRTGYGSNKWTVEQCKKATNNDAAFVRDNEHNRNENFCEVPADTYEQCIGEDELTSCREDFEERWACAMDYPMYTSCESLGDSYTYDWYNKGYPEAEQHTSVCRLYGPGPSSGSWDDASEAYVREHCTEDLGKPTKLRTKEEQCMSELSQESKCYYNDASADCNTLAPGDGFSVQEKSNGKCQISSNSGGYYWSSEITSTKMYKEAEKCKVLSAADAKWTLAMGKIWTPGEFETEEKCNVGACNMGHHFNEEQCAQEARCNRHLCDGCERDWSSANDNSYSNNVCVYTGTDITDQAGCQTKFGSDMADFDADLEKCIVQKNGGKWQCNSMKDTEYFECYDMSIDTCSGDNYDTAPSIARNLLNCRATPSAECKTQEACEASGECIGGLRRRYWFDGEEHYLDNVCVAPKTDFHGHGWLDCTSYYVNPDQPDWQTVEQSETECILLKKSESECNLITGAVWTSTKETQETCEDKQMCKVNDWRFNTFDETECSKCEKDFQYVATWEQNKWTTGKMTDTFYWIDRKWEDKNKWISEIDSWRLDQVMRELVERLEEETEAQFVQCMYTGLMSSVKKIACVCGENRDECDSDEIFNGLATIVNTTAYKNAKEIAGNEMTTRLELERASVESVNNITLEEQGAYVPSTNTTITKDGEGSRRLRREKLMRRLDESSDTLNSAECMTVVKNDNDVLVGQLVGNCVKANFSESLATASTLCLDIKPVIDIADAFTVKGFADYDQASNKYTARPDVAVMQGEQYCITVSETSFLCPINRIEDYASATEDAGSDECNLVVHIVDRVRKQQECNEGLSCHIGTPEFWAGVGAIGLTLIIIGACCFFGCCGACAHKPTRQKMNKAVSRLSMGGGADTKNLKDDVGGFENDNNM
jgi:hypothetical protein